MSKCRGKADLWKKCAQTDSVLVDQLPKNLEVSKACGKALQEVKLTADVFKSTVYFERSYKCNEII